MVESAGFENRYLGQPGSRVRIPPSPPASKSITSFASQNAERCRSGLTGTPGKRVWAYTHRRFESCPLRQPQNTLANTTRAFSPRQQKIHERV